MSSVEELADLAQFDLQVVLADLESDPHLLHIERLGLLAVLLGLLGLLVVILAPVYDAGHWRFGSGRDLDEVEPGLFGGS